MAGLAPLDQGEKAHLRRGRLLEPVGARLVVEDYGMKVVAEQERVERTDIPALSYIDLRTMQGRIELKTVNQRDFERDWVGRAPLYPRTQAQCQLAITSDAWCYVGAIVIGWSEIRLELFEERRHAGMQQLLLDRAGEFLRTLERGDLPPQDETSSSYAAWSAFATIAGGETIRLLDPEAVERAAKWRDAKSAGIVSKQLDEECKAWFAARCGEAETIELPDGTQISRKRVARNGYQVQPSTYINWRVR